jgi:hypothetical protein
MSYATTGRPVVIKAPVPASEVASEPRIPGAVLTQSGLPK